MNTARGVDIVVVDYGLGNLRSVVRGLERAGAEMEVTADPARISSADGIVLPGVGAFSEGMENAEPLRDELVNVASAGTPFLGICLGMQMLLSESEEAKRAGEGDARGLELIPGKNVRFHSGKVPHMGWNQISVVRDNPLLSGVNNEYAYFVHSYYAVPDDDSSVIGMTEYSEEFASVIARDNVYGTQFHPEKSGKTGLRILKNFVAICS